MTINNNILEIAYEPNSAVEFMYECPLTLGGLKRLFLINDDFEGSIEEYEENLELWCEKDDENNLFRYLNEVIGWSDAEVIEEILENEEDEYYIDFIQVENGGEQDFWRIYKINKEVRK